MFDKVEKVADSARRPLYKICEEVSNPASDHPHRTCTLYCSWAFQSCGIGTMEGLSTWPQLYTWDEKAAWISALYRNLYCPGHVIYCPSDYQLKQPGHLALLELGSHEIANFNNIYHAPNRMHVFLVNIRNADGRFCNQYGEPYKEPPKEVPAIDPDPKPLYSYAELPRRSK